MFQSLFLDIRIKTSKHKTANECSWRQLFIRLRAWSVADEFGAPSLGSKPSLGSRAIARQSLPRDRAAYGVSSHWVTPATAAPAAPSTVLFESCDCGERVTNGARASQSTPLPVRA